MAENRIVQARFQRRLAEELDIANPAPVPVLAPEIVPVILVEGERPETLHLASEHRFGCSIAQGAVAGEYAYFYVVNPASSGGLVIIEDVYVASSATGAVDFGYYNTTFVASLAGRSYRSLDERVAQTPTGVPGMALVYTGTDANTGGVVNPFLRVRTLANVTNPVKGINYVLQPGAGFGLWLDPVNTAFYGGVQWRERHANNGELV